MSRARQHAALLALPDDMQQLLADLADDAGVGLPELLPLRVAPLERFPAVAVDNGGSDGRGAAYAMKMHGKQLPPLVVIGGYLVDGRHRLTALRQQSARQAFFIDLGDLLPVPVVPCIGPMNS